MTRAAHIASIVSPEVIGGVGEIQAGQWTARCSCGWTSASYWQEEYATRALTDHLASLPPVEEEIRTIDEWLVLALDPIKQEIASSEEADKLFYIGARLTEIETKIEVAFGEIRARLNERLGYVTGRVKGQG